MKTGRIGMMGLVVLTAAMAVQAQDRTINIYLQDSVQVPNLTMWKAKATASRIYAQLHIRLAWHIGTERKGDTAAIMMQIDRVAPATSTPDALAFATPQKTSGTRIHILVSRVNSIAPPSLTGVVLGHVMAHEIGHVLEGGCRHAESGVMKARWDLADFSRMTNHVLTFSDADINAIDAGVARMFGLVNGEPVAAVR